MGLEDVRYCDDHDYMNLQYGVKRMGIRPFHTFFILSAVGIYHNMSNDYVSKMVYNKDKDLVFAYKPDGLWGDKEYVYETHHLERMVPSPVTSWKELSAYREDGIVTVHDMCTKDYLKLYGEKKYWNIDLRDDFMH